MQVAILILEAVLLAATLSIDAFIASFAYGSNKIKIPFRSVLAINIVCSGILGLAILFGSLLRPYLSKEASSWICFSILLFIGLAKLLDNITKSVIRKHSGLTKKIRFSFFNFKFVLSVYANPEKADRDSSKNISIGEAISLAVALSLDGIAVGFGASLGNVNGLAVFLASFVTEAIAVLLGVSLGHKLSSKLKFNVSWLSGLVLIILAFTKIG